MGVISVLPLVVACHMRYHCSASVFPVVLSHTRDPLSQLPGQPPGDTRGKKGNVKRESIL